MTHLLWLSDNAWAAIEPHLPRGKPGKPRVDDRRVISGIVHVLKTGCRWRDCPAKYGPHTTIYNRYNRWSKRRIWQRILEKMAAAGPVPEELCGDEASPFSSPQALSQNFQLFIRSPLYSRRSGRVHIFQLSAV